MTPQHFSATITRAGTRTIVSVPFNPNDVWGERERHYIAGSVDGHPVRGVLESAGTKFFLAVGPAWLRDNNLEIGTMVRVELHLEGPLSEELASDIASALAANPKAKAFFDSMPTFYRKNYIRWIESAKRPQTRAERIAGTIEFLKSGKRLT